MNVASPYREFAPPAALAERLVCLWTQTLGEVVHTQTVLPDGCVDIVWVGEQPAKVAGPATHEVQVRLPAGTRLIGARFRPGWAAASFGVPASELRDAEVALSELWRDDAARALDCLDPERTAQHALDTVAMALSRRLAAAPRADAEVAAAVRWLARRPAGRVSRMARDSGLGERPLQRRFDAAVGYGPKTLQRVLRLQRLLAAPALSLSQLAPQLGYADQAHMCRDLRALTGATPRQLSGQGPGGLAMSDLFNTGGD